MRLPTYCKYMYETICYLSNYLSYSSLHIVCSSSLQQRSQQRRRGFSHVQLLHADDFPSSLCAWAPVHIRGAVHSNDWRLLFAKVHPCLAWTCWLEHSPRPWMRHSARASATVALSPFAPLTGLPAGHAIGQHFVPSHGRAARNRSGLDTKGQQAMTPRWFGWMGEQVSALYGARQSLRPSIY